MLRVLLIAALLPATSLAAPRLERVAVASDDDAIDLTLSFDEAIPADAGSTAVVSRDAVLVVRVNGARAARRWVKLSDRWIERSLILPGRQPPAALLRVRMKITLKSKPP